MNKTLLVIRQELINTFKRPSYLILAFVIPLLAVLILGGVKLIKSRSQEGGATAISTSEEWQMETEGYVDQSGLIRTIPTNLPQGHLLPYETEAQARQALTSEEITAYYLIPSDYLETGEVFYVYPETKALISDGQKWVIKWTLMVNLQGGDTEGADRLWNPVWHLEEINISASQAQANAPSGEDCSRPGSACTSNDLIRYIPSIMAALFFMSFMNSSTMLFNSIGIEKENRTLEVLLLSISPQQMLAGKTIGLVIAGLVQTVSWLSATFTLFNMGGSTLSLPENFTFPVNIVLWSIVFFLGGFGVYASLMAGAGALVPKLKEAGPANIITMAPLLLGYMVGIMAPLAEAANAAAPFILSFFPLTSPIVMVMRLTDSFVPVWQLMLSALLLFATSILITRATAAMFHAQNLLSGQPFSAKRYFQMLFSRV